MAAEVGQLSLAFDYLGEAALIDLDDLQHNSRDGVHIASLAGTWIALIAGFGGLRHCRRHVSFAPRLPDGITRLAFTILIRGRLLRVEVTHSSARYLLTDGDPLDIEHHGKRLTLVRWPAAGTADPGCLSGRGPASRAARTPGAA